MSFRDAADVGFGHGDDEFHLPQVFRDGEEFRSGEGGGDGLADLELAEQDGAVDGRADDGLFEVALVRLHVRLGFSDRGLRAFQVGLRAFHGGLRGVHVRFRGRLAAAQLVELERSLVGGGAFAQGCLRLRDAGLG